MTSREKTGHVEVAKKEIGLGAALELLDLPRSTWFYQQHRSSYVEKHADLVGPLMKATADHPDFGYRRMATELGERVDRPVNQKVIRRLNKALSLTPLRKPAAPRKSAIRRVIQDAGSKADLIRDREEIDLYEVLCTDFTEIPYAAGKAVLMPILDYHSKDIVGWALESDGTQNSRWLGR